MTTDTLPAPTCEELKALRAVASDACWSRRYRRALQKVAVVDALVSRCGARKPGRGDLRAVVPKEDRTNALRWWTEYHKREGEPWERLFDRRVAHKAWETPEAWRITVEALGSQDLQPSFEEIRAVLRKRFGPNAGLGDTTLRAILQEAGLFVPVDRSGQRVEQVTELSGGGGLVLLAAAVAETKALCSMAEDVVELARAQASPAEPVPAEPEGRDDLGHFTAEYNRTRLALLQEQDQLLFGSVDESRKDKDLSRLRLAKLKPETLANHLACTMAMPLVTMRRGTAGLDGPAGAWLEVLSPVAYRAKTIDKTLSQLKWLDAAPTMWARHAETWLHISVGWSSEEGWRQVIYYIDATKDPWWTQRFARSGKVSRTGRVQPCLDRAILTSGPGVPIIGEVSSGSGKLVPQMFAMLDQADEILGDESVRRITVVDAECCQFDVLRRFAADPMRDIITVLKGSFAKGKTFEAQGEWLEFRRRDQLREGLIDLEPKRKEPGGLKLRVVEMLRRDSRNPQATWFVTTAAPTELDTEAVARAYLSRWPHQEDVFRRGRNGAGLERSHGYGVSAVSNLAVVGKREKAVARLSKAIHEVLGASDGVDRAEGQLAKAKARLDQKKHDAVGKLDGRHKLGVRQAKSRLDERAKLLKQAERKQDKATAEYKKLRSMPDEVYVRDTALDSVATCLKMTLLALLEFICREYLGGRRIMPRTFIEAWVTLPVTIRKSRHRLVYEVADNPRAPEISGLLRYAFERVTKRKLRVDGRLLVAQVRDGP